MFAYIRYKSENLAWDRVYPDGYLEAQTGGWAESDEEADNKREEGTKEKGSWYVLYIAFNWCDSLQTQRLLVPPPRRVSNLGTS